VAFFILSYLKIIFSVKKILRRKNINPVAQKISPPNSIMKLWKKLVCFLVAKASQKQNMQSKNKEFVFYNSS
jgi:hypothetical protein